MTTGITVPFSDEYRVRQANMRLLEQLAEQKPSGGEAGMLAPALESDNLDEVLRLDTYRPGVPAAKSLKDVWPLALLLGASLFFADVFVRRVALDLGAPLRKLASALRRSKHSEVDQKRQASLDRLRSSKTQVAGDLERQRSQASFDFPDKPSGVSGNAAGSEASSFGSGPTKSSSGTPADAGGPAAPRMSTEEEKSYTSRLLDAKRQAKKKS
jgi:hypothetical protein